MYPYGMFGFLDFLLNTPPSSGDQASPSSNPKPNVIHDLKDTSLSDMLYADRASDHTHEANELTESDRRAESNLIYGSFASFLKSTGIQQFKLEQWAALFSYLNQTAGARLPEVQGNELSFPILHLLYTASPSLFFEKDIALGNTEAYEKASTSAQNLFFVKRIKQLDTNYAGMKAALERCPPQDRWFIFFKHMTEMVLDINGQIKDSGFKELVTQLKKPETSFSTAILNAIYNSNPSHQLFNDTTEGLKKFIVNSMKIFELTPIEIVDDAQVGDYCYEKLAHLFGLSNQNHANRSTQPQLLDSLLLEHTEPHSSGIFTESGYSKLIQLWHNLVLKKERYTPHQRDLLDRDLKSTLEKVRAYYQATPRRPLSDLAPIIMKNHIMVIFMFEQWLTFLATQYKDEPNGLHNLGIEDGDDNVGLLALIDTQTKAFIEALLNPEREDADEGVLSLFKRFSATFDEAAKTIQYIRNEHFDQIKLDQVFQLVQTLIAPVNHRAEVAEPGDARDNGIDLQTVITEFLSPIVAPKRLLLLLAQLTDDANSMFATGARTNILNGINQKVLFNYYATSPSAENTQQLNRFLEACIKQVQTIPDSTTSNRFDLIYEILQQPWVSVLAIHQSALLFGEIEGEADKVDEFKTQLVAKANQYCQELINYPEKIDAIWFEYLLDLTRSFENRPNLPKNAAKYIQLIKQDEDISSIAFFNKLSGFYLCLAQSKEASINETLVWMRLVHAFTSTILECDHGIRYHNEVISKQLKALFIGLISTAIVIAATILYIYQSWTIFYLMIGSVALTACIGLLWYHLIENKGLGRNYSLSTILTDQVKFLQGLGSSCGISQMTKGCVDWYKELLNWLSQCIDYVTAKLPLMISSTLMGLAFGIAISIPIWALMLQNTLNPFWLAPSLAITCIALICYNWASNPVDPSINELMKTNRATDMSIATMFNKPAAMSATTSPTAGL